MMRKLRITDAGSTDLLQNVSYEYKEIADELHTSVANLYNIKKRAMTEFTAIVLKEYGYE